MKLVCGIDSSTQSTKAELRDVLTGTLVASGSGAHPPTTPPASQQDPNAWMAALGEALGQVDSHLDEVVGISVAGQQHGLVVVDEHSTVIRPAKLWNDTTSAPQAERLRSTFRPEAWANRCGLVPVASFTITKLAWLAENEPENLERVAKVMLPHDWLTWMLSGNHVTDRGDASGTGWWSSSVGYRSDLLDHAVPDAEAWIPRLPTVLGPSESAGIIRSDIAEAFGLSKSCVIGPGTGDNMGAALGIGLRPGDVAVSLGTSGTAYAVSETQTVDRSGAVAGFADATGRFLPLIATLNATKVTDTVARWLGTNATGLATLALQADRKSTAPVLVPYFDGERTPNLPLASGEFVGLRTDTTRGELARAAHSGVACGLLDGVDALRDADVPIDGTLHLIGGGARSTAYQQIMADLWGAPIAVHANGEHVATGACVQAAAVAEGTTVDDIQRRWSLGTATMVSPTAGIDRVDIRERYANASARVAAQFDKVDPTYGASEHAKPMA